jgi:UDP-N-acetylglucosamine acyltransferase
LSAGIHPTAIVAREAQLAPDVEVGAYTVIGAGVTVGERCRIGPHVVLQGPTRIGTDNHIFQFASIGDAPQDKKYQGEPTRLEIGDRNVFRECTTINRGTVTGHGVTRIGSDCLFMAYAHVAHDCIVGDKCIFSNATALAGHVEVDDWVILSGYSAVHQFCKIGAHVFLANNAAVTRDVPPFLMVAGAPAEPKGINAEGLKRRGFGPQQIANIKQAYRTLYRSQLKIAEATERLKELAAAAPELKLFVDFLPRVTRSLIR